MPKAQNVQILQLLDTVKEEVEREIGTLCNETRRAQLVRVLATRLYHDGWRK